MGENSWDVCVPALTPSKPRQCCGSQPVPPVQPGCWIPPCGAQHILLPRQAAELPVQAADEQ